MLLYFEQSRMQQFCNDMSTILADKLCKQHCNQEAFAEVCSDDAHMCQQHCLQVYFIGLSIMSLSGVHTGTTET